MENHYTQPPFGLPFAFPPKPPQEIAPTAPPDPQGGPQDPRHAPPAEDFQNNWNIPGLNLNSYAQNTQQPQYSPAAWPPPTPLPNAWGALPFPFLPNGVIPPPPPPIPGLNIPPAPFSQAPPQNASAQAPFPMPPTQPPQRPMASANDRITEIMESDKEDGEVSDGDRASHSPAGNDPLYSEPPRSVPQAQQDSSRPGLSTAAEEQEPYDPDRLLAAQMGTRQPSRQAQQPKENLNNLDKISQQREEAQQFIRLLHSSNIGYHALANEGLDPSLLRELYRSMNLPSEPDSILTLKANSLASSTLLSSADDQHPQMKPATAVKTNVNPTPAAKSAPSPVDRKDYIARLQAAKIGKQSGASKITPPQKTPPSTSAASIPSANTPQPTTMLTPKQPVTDEQRARNTELIKQRLEAIRAKNASSPVAPSGSKPVVSATAPDPNAVPFSPPQEAGLFQGAASQQVLPTEAAQSNQHSQTSSSSFSTIPGLFMTSSIQTPANASPDATGLNPLKRSLAFEPVEVSTPHNTAPSYTRPLGQSPHSHENESMIIEVSDDDSDEMEIDDDQNASKEAADSPPDVIRNGQQNFRNFPHMANFPSRPSSVKPASSTVSTPGPQTPATLARKEELEKKERELAAMRLTLKKKLEERKQKEKAAASAPSIQKSTLQVESTQAVAPIKLRSAPSDTSDIAPQGNNPVVSSSMIDSTMSRESKRKRRAEIESGLPSLEAEIASNTAKMDRLTRELEELAANNAKITQDKERLVRELESLGIDTEGISHAELQAKKNEIELEKEAEKRSKTRSPSLPTPLSEEISNVEHVLTSPPLTGAIEASTSAQSLDNNIQPTIQVHTHHSQIPGLHATSAPLPTAVALSPHLPIAKESMTSDINTGRIPSRQLEASHENVHSESLQPLPEINSVNATAAVTRDSATPVDDDEDFYSPEPAADILSKDKPESPKPLEVGTQSPSEEGEIEMEESEEDEYEPEEPQIVAVPVIPDAVRQDVDASTSSASPLASSDVEEEPNEPPDVDHEMDDVKLLTSTADASIESSVQQVEGEDGAMDISTSSSEDSDDSNDSDSDQQSKSETMNNDLISSNTAPVQNNSVADDLAPELQSEHVATRQASANDPNLVVEEVDEPVRFVPYESPLRMFKSYRYHPNYSEDIAGGFLSMTYSHQIDPEKPLCQYESVGGTCNDPQCLDQHFRGMNITGDKLLVQLGTANPGKTPEEKQLWNDGLRGVLKELRQKNIKDPNGIAIEIAKYRRQFLNDDTRVVNL